MQEIRERVSALDARFESFEKYEHERWHKLANDLQPLIVLPIQIAKDFGSLEGKIGHAISKAVADAVSPIHEELATLRAKVEALEKARAQFSGGRQVTVWIVQTAIAAIAAVAAVLAIGHAR